jgi:hypothetical protein
MHHDTMYEPTNNNTRNVLGVLFAFVAALILIADGTFTVLGNYEYSKSIESYWSLADKASTIPQKSTYIDKFVAALEASSLQGQHNAVVLDTPDNSFDSNLEALKTLQTRLHEIAGMDVTSFQYQTAIQQITGQEQGEAHHLLGIFEGCWWKVHHFFLWGWVGCINVLGSIILFIVGLCMRFADVLTMAKAF